MLTGDYTAIPPSSSLVRQPRTIPALTSARSSCCRRHLSSKRAHPLRNRMNEIVETGTSRRAGIPAGEQAAGAGNDIRFVTTLDEAEQIAPRRERRRVAMEFADDEVVFGRGLSASTAPSAGARHQLAVRIPDHRLSDLRMRQETLLSRVTGGTTWHSARTRAGPYNWRRPYARRGPVEVAPRLGRSFRSRSVPQSIYDNVRSADLRATWQHGCWSSAPCAARRVGAVMKDKIGTGHRAVGGSSAPGIARAIAVGRRYPDGRACSALAPIATLR